MVNKVVVWRIVDWDGRYETSRTLKKTGPLAAVTLSADLGRVVIRKLLGRPDSAAILGVWYFLQMLAAQGDRRGVLSSQGAPLTSRDLASLSGLEVPLIERVLEVLGGPEVRLMEQVPLEVALQPPVIEPPKPRKPRQSRPRAFFRCPKCDADLVQLAESGEFEHLLVPETEVESDGHACACGSNHGGHCGPPVATCSANVPPSAERKGAAIPQKSLESNSEGSRTLAASATEGPSRESQPEVCDETATFRPHKPRSATTACRKNRKVERQARKNARRIQARRK